MLTVDNNRITSEFYGKVESRTIIGPALTKDQIASIRASLTEGYSLDWALAGVGVC